MRADQQPWASVKTWAGTAAENSCVSYVSGATRATMDSYHSTTDALFQDFDAPVSSTSLHKDISVSVNIMNHSRQT